MKYYNNLRSEMLEFIPQNSTKILEVGCGEGLFGELVMKKRLSEVWGVEPFNEAAKKAEKRLTKVINSYYDENILLPENYFDCIVFNDVLEHMIDPWSILKFTKRFLIKNNAFIVASIPNFRYWYNLKEIVLYKDFNYQDSGILDKTHLRFFTNSSIIGMFKKSGFDVIRIQGITSIKSREFRLINLMLFNKITDMKYMQFAVVAKLKTVQ